MGRLGCAHELMPTLGLGTGGGGGGGGDNNDQGYRGIVLGSSGYVAVGTEGILDVAPVGGKFDGRDSGVRATLNGVTFANGVYVDMVNNMARNAGIQGTPTIKINGTETSLVPNGDPNSLIEKIKAVAPNLPNLTAVPAPQPAPAPHP